MVRQLIVPIDGSEESWRGADVAIGLARRCGAVIDIVQVEPDPVEVQEVQRRLDASLARRHVTDVEMRLDVRVTVDLAASQIEDVARDAPGAIVVMSSLGRGRSAAVVGSVAQDVLRRIENPVMFVGPKAEIDLRAGPVVMPVDGSADSEVAISATAAWAESLQTSIRIVRVIAPPSGWAPDYVEENGYLAEVAARVRELSGREVDFDVLQHVRPGKAVADDAEQRSASLIVASSRTRDGLARVLLGSVTSELVRRAACPVVIVRRSESEASGRDAAGGEIPAVS